MYSRRHQTTAHDDIHMSAIQPFVEFECLMTKNKHNVAQWGSLQIWFSTCLNTLISSPN